MEELLSLRARGIMPFCDAAEFLGIPEETLRKYRKDKANPIYQGFFVTVPGGRAVWVDTRAVIAAMMREREERVAAAKALAEAEATDENELDDAA